MVMRYVRSRSAYEKNDGFTLLEMLLSLSILIVVASLLPLIIVNLSAYKAAATDSFNINFELAARDVYDETSNKTLSCSKGVLYAKDDKRTYSYLYQNGRLVRKVDDEGYTILLEKVKSSECIDDNGIKLIITREGSRRMMTDVLQIK